MNENPTPNDPPLSNEQRRIQELEAENAKLRADLERANEFKEGYKALYIEMEDWDKVEQEMKELIASTDTCTLGDLIRQLESEGNQESGGNTDAA